MVGVLAVAAVAALDRHAHLVGLAIVVAVLAASLADITRLIFWRREANSFRRPFHIDDLKSHAFTGRDQKTGKKNRYADHGNRNPSATIDTHRPPSVPSSLAEVDATVSIVGTETWAH